MQTGSRHLDPALPTQDRVEALLGQMTRDERIAQLGAVWAFDVLAPDGSLRETAADLLREGLGAVTRVAGSTNLRPAQVARAANEIQRHLIERTRLGIPALLHEECLHGLLGWEAPCFQQSIGAAATFDPELVASTAATIRRRMLATGARHALAPVLDIGRDPRWGRIEETYGEDPYLATEMGIAYTQALQGATRDGGIVATGKHMTGHGFSEGGLNQAPVHAGWREIRDEQLVPFEAAIREADLRSIMPAYCDVDGVPCHASIELLQGILREEWGFDGIVSADYTGVEMLNTLHRLTDDPAEAAALALSAGVDLELPRTAYYADALRTALDDGRVAPELLDAAVRRVLTVKFELGLFEHPYTEVPTEQALAAMRADETEIGARLACTSMVLAQNRGSLPLSPDAGRVAVIGPIADSARELLGDYSHLLHIQTLLEMRQHDNPFGFSLADDVQVEDELAGRRTILDALRDRLGPGRVRYARGTGIRGGTDEDLAEAVALASGSDVAILVLGERSGLTEDATTGEFRDRRDLGFLGRQQELLDAVAATGTPVVLVVVSGRPLALERAAAVADAVVLAWVPGDFGADAIADVLTGACNPGGKLPISMLRHVGQVPLSYRHHASGGRSNWKGDHVDGLQGPLWPFGYGGSYTTFALNDLALSAATLPTADGTVSVSVSVRNTGDRRGDETVQLYLRDEEAQVSRPVLELAGFRRVALESGECRRVTFTLHSDQLAFTGVDYRRVVEPGRITVSVGTSSADRPLEATLALTGPTVTVERREHFRTSTNVA